MTWRAQYAMPCWWALQSEAEERAAVTAAVDEMRSSLAARDIADSAAAERQEQRELVGPPRYCTPRHRHALPTLVSCAKQHAMTWRALPARRLTLHVIDTHFKHSSLELTSCDVRSEHLPGPTCWTRWMPGGARATPRCAPCWRRTRRSGLLHTARYVVQHILKPSPVS